MAKGIDEIRMNFKNAINQANKLEEAASSIEKITKVELVESTNEIFKYWKGNSSIKYHNKSQKAVERLLIIAKKLKQTAKIIKEIAETTYKAEMRALELAQKRDYK